MSYFITNEDMILSVHLRLLTIGTLGFPIRIQSHLTSPYKPFSCCTTTYNRMVVPPKVILWWIYKQQFWGNKHEQKADGNPLLPECYSSQSLTLGKDSLHWGLGRELWPCVYTVNSSSSCDHKIMVSDNRSWLRFKVKNNSLLVFSPLGLWSKKSVIWEGSQSIVGTWGVRWAQWPTGSQPSLWLSHFLCLQCTSRQKHHYCSWILHWWILGSETAQNKLAALWPVMESWMDPWQVSQHLVFPLIQAHSRKCYTTIFPMVVFVSLISRDELVAAFPIGLRMKQMLPQSAMSLAADIILHFYWMSLQVKGQGCECKRCTESCQRVNLSVGQRPRQREEQDSNGIVLHKTGSSHTIKHVLVS